MDEVHVTLSLFYEGNLTPSDLLVLQDRLGEFLEKHADDLLEFESAELTDYSIEVERTND